MTNMATLQSAAQALKGKTVWHAWRGVGSHLFFELGTPETSVSSRTLSRTVNGVVVESRRAGVRGSHSIGIEMAQWQLFFGASAIAHSESPDDVYNEILRWIEGQQLVELRGEEQGVFSLQFDLRARFELRNPSGFEPDSTLLSIRVANEVTSLRVDGGVQVEPWSS